MRALTQGKKVDPEQKTIYFTVKYWYLKSRWVRRTQSRRSRQSIPKDSKNVTTFQSIF